MIHVMRPDKLIIGHGPKKLELLKSILKKAAEGLKAIKNSVDRVTSTRPRTSYSEIAEACEGVNDALLREEGGTTAKVTKVAAVKFGAIGTSAGIFAIAATVGTASTGTAIGALTGAAATSATLAWIGGSVTMGGAIVGAVAVAGGIGFAAGALWVFRKYWRGNKRLRGDLSERVLRIAEVTSKLAVACRRMAVEGGDTDPLS